MEWKPPPMATVYVIQPLSEEFITLFLKSRGPFLSKEANVRGEEYEQFCSTFVKEILNKKELKGVSNSSIEVLSNPMDLTVISDIIANGENPDLYRLQKQQFTIMAQDFDRRHPGKKFPFIEFSENVYQMRLNDRSDIDFGKFGDELERMKFHKMVLRRHATNKDGGSGEEWYFRHDKIMEFFIVQTFLGKYNERPEKHLGDPRFRGTYLLLAKFLNEDEAIALQDKLIQYAAETKDHAVCDEFILLLRERNPIGKGAYPQRKIIRRDKIFISYSHKDLVWLKKLQTMMSPLSLDRKLSIWDDTQIKAGMDWGEEISKALSSAKVAVLLVSPDFLASEFIAKKELNPLIEASEKGNAKLLWVGVSSCLYKHSVIEKFQAANDPNCPLDSLKEYEQKEELGKICETIFEAFKNA